MTNILIRLFAIVFLVFFLSSCGQLQLEDVSSSPQYSFVVEKVFRTRQDLWEIGVTTDSNYKRMVDYIVLVPGTGFTGPEVIYRKRLESGVKIKIKKVLEGDTFFSKRLIYIVEVPGSKKFDSYEVRVSVTEPINFNYGLDPAVYEAIN